MERTKINDYEEPTTWYDGGAYPLQDAFFASSGPGHITEDIKNIETFFSRRYLKSFIFTGINVQPSGETQLLNTIKLVPFVF